MERCGAVSTARAAPWLFCREEEGEQVDDDVDVDRGEGAVALRFGAKFRKQTIFQYPVSNCGIFSFRGITSFHHLCDERRVSDQDFWRGGTDLISYKTNPVAEVPRQEMTSASKTGDRSA